MYRIGGGYVATAGTMSTVHVVVGTAAPAGHKATVYVYTGGGVGSTFLAMSDEFPIDSTGEKTANISGTLTAITYSLCVQGNAGSTLFRLIANSGSDNSVGRNYTSGITYRSPPGTMPTENTDSGQEFIIWVDGTPPTSTLTANVGPFVLTGESATLTFGTGAFSLVLSTGTYSLTGGNATLTVLGNWVLVTNPGAFDLLGGLSTSDDHMDAVDGIFTLNGGVLSFNGATFSVTGATGLFALTGPTTLLQTSVQFVLIAVRGVFIEYVPDITGALICDFAVPHNEILNLEIVTEAFQKIGVVDETQAPSAEQGANGLRILNDYLLNQAADGMRLGWFRQTDLAAIAPLRAEDVWGVKVLLARQLASHYGITVQDPLLLANMVDAERLLTKRSIKYFESDLSELSRPQGGPFGGPAWF